MSGYGWYGQNLVLMFGAWQGKRESENEENEKRQSKRESENEKRQSKRESENKKRKKEGKESADLSVAIGLI